MATKEAEFSSKINSLKNYIEQVTSYSPPMTIGQDLANTIDWFTGLLLGILKVAPHIEGEEFCGARFAVSNTRLAMFPTLNYSGLYDTLCNFLPLAHSVTVGQTALMDSTMRLVACIGPFLSWHQLISLPYTVALMIPSALVNSHQDIIKVLCVNLLPNTLGIGVEENLIATESVAAILMLVLQHCADTKLHTRITECLLPLRPDLYRDLFTVIAYGPPATTLPATCLLFHYWPQLNLLTGSDLLLEMYTVTPWQVSSCQRINCINRSAQPDARKLCSHPNMCVTEANLPPPVYICIDCFDTSAMRAYDGFFEDIVIPAESISTACCNKNCSSPGSRASTVCASVECVRMNRFRPVSLCLACHTNRHPGKCGYVQQSIPNIWTLEQETQSYIVDGIVNLLREAEPEQEVQKKQVLLQSPAADPDYFPHRRSPINSRYGILLLKELCRTSTELNLSVDALGRLLGMLFRWFQCTGSTCNQASANHLEKLKTEHMTGWLQEVKKSHYEVILSTLLPHPPDVARVGGQWEQLSSRTEQIKEGLEKLILLGPYDIVTYEVWDYIMPYWLESIRTELSLKEREEVKVLLSKTFDIEMSPLPFLLDKMYHFIDERFEATDPQIQEQGLQWLQILTSVDIAIPFVTLLKMFREGVVCLLGLDKNDDHLTGRTPKEVKLSCFILMLDILLRQSDLSRMPPHAGVTQNKSREMFTLLRDMIGCVKDIDHDPTCQDGEGDCRNCHSLTILYQLSCNLLIHICPRLEIRLPVTELSKLGVTSVSTDDAQAHTDTPVVHQLFTALLQELRSDQDVDITYYVAQSLKYLLVHGCCLQLVSRTQSAVVDKCLEETFIPRLWELLQGKRSRTSGICVIMLLHAVSLRDGKKYLWNLVNRECTNNHWKIRYAAVEKIRMMWEFSTPEMVMKNQLAVTSLCHLFCQYIELLQDKDHNVAQRAQLQLSLMSENSRSLIVQCLASQFDTVAKDRHLIINKLTQLQNAMPERKVLSWSFFLSRLQQLFLEAEMDKEFVASQTVRAMLVPPGSSPLGRILATSGVITQLSSGQNLDQMVKIAKFVRSDTSDCLGSITEHTGIGDSRAVSVPSSGIRDKSRKNSSSSAPSLSRISNNGSKSKKLSSTTLTDSATQEDYYSYSSDGSESSKSSKEDEDGSPFLAHLMAEFKRASDDNIIHENEEVMDEAVHLSLIETTRKRSRRHSAPHADRRHSAPHADHLIRLIKRHHSRKSHCSRRRPSFIGLTAMIGFKDRYEVLCDNVSSENGRLISVLLKALDKGKLDSSVLHLLVSSIMKFMATKSSAVEMEASKAVDPECAAAKHQTAVVGHMFHLLGYNDGKFCVQPGRMRQSPILHAVLSNLSKFLDSNIQLGTRLLPDVLNLLKFCGSPQRYASDAQSQDYTLGILPKSMKKPWIQTLQIVLYKYNYGNNGGAVENRDVADNVNYLVHIVLNTLGAQVHKCKKGDTDDGLPIIPMKDISEANSSTASDVADEEPPSMDKKDSNSNFSKLASRDVEKQDSNSRSRHESDSTYYGTLTSGKKSKLVRQYVVDNEDVMPVQGSRHSAASAKSNGKLSKQEEIALLENPQKIADALSNPCAASPKSSTIDRKTPNLKKGDSAGSMTKSDKQDSSRLGSVLHKMKKQGSKSDMFDAPGSTTEEDRQLIQTAAAAMDFMARSKRAPPPGKVADNRLSAAKQRKRSSIPSSSSQLLPTMISSCSGPGTMKREKSTLGGAQSQTSKCCIECGAVLEECEEEILVLCIVAIETYLNHELHLAASMVYEMIESVCQLAKSRLYSWQSDERSVFIPGNLQSSAMQFIRCSLHHLNSYNIMTELLSSSENSDMFTMIATALTDFPEMSSQQALLTALEGMNEKELPSNVKLSIDNINSYLSSMTVDSAQTQEWPKIIDSLEIYVRKLSTAFPMEGKFDISCLLQLMTTILKLPVVNGTKNLIDTCAKLLVTAMKTHTVQLMVLADLCNLCHRTFSKDREKTILGRMVVGELIQVIKYKSVLPECNILILLEIVCMDYGSTLLPTHITKEIPYKVTSEMIMERGIVDIMKQYIGDCIEFISDLQSLNKLKAHMKAPSMHEDTFGGLFKTGISQIVALEFSRLLQTDSKAIQRFLPWLHNQPNIQGQGPREFMERVDHLRFLCWLYIGALTHHSIAEFLRSTRCQPLPLDDVLNMSVIVELIITGFADNGTASVEYMSSLFYAFILCQVWTMYCETLNKEGIDCEIEEDMDIGQIIYDFWARVTPVILSLMASNNVLAEMVSLHVLGMMETLQECHSSVLVKLFALWRSLLHANHNKLPVNVQVRLQTVENWQPSEKRLDTKAMLFDWVKKVQFKLAQIEVQTATAAKFLSV